MNGLGIIHVPDEVTIPANRPTRKLDRLPKIANEAPRTISDDALVERARRDDQWAIEQLIHRYQSRVYAIAYQMSSADAEEAKDRVQEAFFQAFRKIRQFKGKSSFYTWLYRIVVNTCIDAQRRRKRWYPIVFPWRASKSAEDKSDRLLDEYPDKSEESDPLSVLRHQQLEKEVKKALQSLSQKQRTVFQLKIFQEMSIPEIASILNLAEGTVKTHLFRATQFVQRRLQGWMDN
jgi:RNA polymerase sigma-70 factor (ECF subfamily)